MPTVHASCRRARCTIAGVLVALATPASSWALPLFLRLPEAASAAYGVSGDGRTVVGVASGLGNEAFRWTESGGLERLGDLPGGTTFGVALSASADGSVVVGHGNSGTGQEAFRWTADGGMVGLGYLTPDGFSTANDVSADGSLAVGSSTFESPSGNQNEAFGWTELGGMVGLGDLPGGFASSIANGVSANGSVVVGSGSSDLGFSEAFRWTEATGMLGLGDLAGGGFGSTAFAVSADGSVIVGQGTSASGAEAFRWTSTGGMVGLGFLPFFDNFSYATAVSADGSVIVGNSQRAEAGAGDAFIWDAEHGIRSLQDVLIERGVHPGPLQSATGISDDGQVIVGGRSGAWVVNLAAPVPEPSSGLLVALGLAGIAALRRRLV